MSYNVDKTPIFINNTILNIDKVYNIDYTVKMSKISYVILMVAIFAIPYSLFAQDEADDWTIEETVDEFGDKTGRKSLLGYSEGKFSNSATTDSLLSVGIGIRNDRLIYLMLLEYGEYPVSHGYRVWYLVHIKDDNGNVHELDAVIDNTGVLLFPDNDEKSLLMLLMTNKHLKFSITEDDDERYRYNFVLNCNGFNEKYKLMMGQ